MTKFCFVCNKSDDPISTLYALPEKPEIRHKWASACSLSETAMKEKIFICSNHFAPEDYISTIGGRYLRSDATPSLELPPQPGFVGPTTYIILPHIYAISPLELESATAMEELVKSESEPELQSPASNAINESVQSEKEPELLLQSEFEKGAIDASKKRRFADPRYIDEIRISDFSSPRRASRVLKVVKRLFEKKCKLVKQLQNNKRYLLKKVTHLEELVTQLRESNVDNANVGVKHNKKKKSK